MTASKPLMSLSLDLDDLWAYLKVKKDNRWESYPSYLASFVPEFLDLLDDLKLSITFFIVGMDASFQKNKDLIKEIVRRGHEVGNHTYNHEPWLHQLSELELEKEVQHAEDLIFEITGQKTIGFRGPGFTWSTLLFDILSRKGYLYDSSTFPTFIGPMARAYYFWISKIDREAKSERKDLYGSFQDGFRPLYPYLWKVDEHRCLLEMPVTTIPIIKAPFHLSYLIYLSSFSRTAMDAYINLAIQTCRASGIGPNFLLHPPDFMDSVQIPEMAFFPGMKVKHQIKKEIFTSIIASFSKYYEITNMSNRAREALGQKLKIKQLR